MARRSAHVRNWKHPRSVYWRHVPAHYIQTAAVIVPIAIGAATASLIAALLVFLMGELLLFALLPHVALFRRSIDARIHRAACERAALLRASWLVRMGSEHRSELERLEVLAARIRRASGIPEDTDHGEGCDWLGLDALLATYIDLSIRHAESMAAFSPADDVRLGEQIRELEATAPKTEATNLQIWTTRRHALLCHRREARRRARDTRALVAEELATIAAVIQWMYEEAAIARATHGQPAGVAARIEAAVDDASAIRELAALRHDDGIDPDVLRLGRHPIVEATSSVQAPARPPAEAPAPRTRVAEAKPPEPETRQEPWNLRGEADIVRFAIAAE